MSLDLPGWVSIKAPPYPRWEAVKDKTLPPVEGVFNPPTAHLFSRHNIRYEPDVADEWSEPWDTLKRGYGDCEDIVLLERALLLAAHWEPAIYMLIAHDLLTRQDHALLITGHALLDCRTPLVLPLAGFADYRPILAFSTTESLTFGKRKAS